MTLSLFCILFSSYLISIAAQECVDVCVPVAVGPKGDTGECSCSDLRKSLIPMRNKVDVCGLGVKTGVIPDNMFSASSYWNNHPRHEPRDARLDSTSNSNSAACWAPNGSDKAKWIGVDFGEIVTLAGVVTQGRPTEYNQWITHYKVSYGVSLNNMKFVKENGNAKVFAGNVDRSSHHINMLPEAVQARYARIHAVQGPGVGLCFRFEFLGC